MTKSVKFRKWEKPKAERAWQTQQDAERKQYYARLRKLVDLIALTVKQKRINGHLSAPDLWSLLLLLKEEVDRMPGGFKARQPRSGDERKGHNGRIQGERALFMRDAFNLAMSTKCVNLYYDGSLFWLYVEHTAPKWLMHRDGQVIENYIPESHELSIAPDEIGDDEFVFTDRDQARLRAWQTA